MDHNDLKNFNNKDIKILEIGSLLYKLISEVLHTDNTYHKHDIDLMLLKIFELTINDLAYAGGTSPYSKFQDDRRKFILDRIKNIYNDLDNKKVFE